MSIIVHKLYLFYTYAVNMSIIVLKLYLSIDCFRSVAKKTPYSPSIKKEKQNRFLF